jgi:hypothetical protein
LEELTLRHFCLLSHTRRLLDPHQGSNALLSGADRFRYYVWDIEESKPLVLVGETQFEQLLKEINSTLKLQLRITNQQREEGLVNRLPDHPRCTPRYLGRSHSRDEYDTMIDNVPAASSRLPSEPIRPSLDSRTLEDFKAAMEEMWDLTKNKNKATKEKKKLGRIQKQKTFTDQFKRAQRYLGLRPCMPKGESNLPGPMIGVQDASKQET